MSLWLCMPLAARPQNGALLAPDGAHLMSAIDQSQAESFAFSSGVLRDDSPGTKGSLTPLRSGPFLSEAR